MSFLDLVAGLPSRPADIRTAASVVLNEQRHLTPLFLQLVRTASKAPEADEYLKVLFDLSCSGSGSDVRVNGPSDAALTVLVLGFGGSSTDILLKHEAVYRAIAPGAKLVLTTASGLSADELALPALEEQLDTVVASLTSSQRIVVHCCSNNGVALWAVLIHRRGAAFTERVGAVVYDCAAEARSDPAHPTPELGVEWTSTWVFNSIWCQVLVHAQELVGATAPSQIHEHAAGLRELRANLLSKTQTMVCHSMEEAKALRAAPPAEGAPPLHATGGWANRRGLFWLERMRFDGDALRYASPYDFVAACQPNVPTLCLTSAEDTVVLPSAVVDWAARLRGGGVLGGGEGRGEGRGEGLAVPPGRSVVVETLRGTHCQLHEQADADAYRLALEALLRPLLVELARETGG